MLNYWHGAIQRLCLLKAIVLGALRQYKQLLIIQRPGHGQQRRGGHVPKGRSFCIPSKFQIHFLFEFSSGGKTGSAHASADPVIDCGMSVVVSNLEEFCQRDYRR